MTRQIAFSWFFIVVALILITGMSVMAKSPVKIWQESITIPTYQVADPDPNPRFYDGRVTQGAQGRVYPYPMSDVLLGEKEPQTYQAVFLENEFVKISVLPELGGRIFTAVDKTNGYDFFYRQSVVKPALIGTLGEWVSGGVEWNFPHHHKATTMMRMDQYLQRNSDGSATLWLAETERRHRFRFTLAITLYPSSSLIKVQINPYNPTPFVHSFLYFANPAVHVDSSYQVIFPPNVDWVTQHAKREFIQWPIASGEYGGKIYNETDISWWKNLTKPVSFFAWNNERDYFAGYNHDKQAGVAYVSNIHIAPGMKFFTFGSGEAGAMWDKMLTDTDGPYLELMAGGYSDNQPDYSWAQPYESKFVSQYWFPIRELDGMKLANVNGALNLELDSNQLAKLRVNTTGVHKNAKIRLSANNQVVLEQTIDIDPGHPYVTDVRVPQSVQETDLKVDLESSAGKTLFSYQPRKPEKKEKPEPVTPPERPQNIKSVEELFFAGLRLDQFYNAQIDPYPYYEEALRRDPGNYLVNTQLGILDCKGFRWEQAEKKLNTALERITNNHTRPKYGEAHYYKGVALRAQKKYRKAYDQFYRATWSHAWHAASYFQLAELDCHTGDYETALEHINRSIQTNMKNLRALNLKTVILRKLLKKEQAKNLAEMISDENPLDLLSRNELYLLDASSDRSSLTELNDIMHGEVETYLELATFYGNCAAWQEAIDVLSRLDVTEHDKGSDYPMLYYYLGYYYAQMGEGQKSMLYYQQASQMPNEYVFPYRMESLDVLRHAIEKNPQDAHAHYYIGNQLFDHQPREGMQHWEKSREIDDSFYIVHRNLGIAYENVETDYNKAILSYEKALDLEKDPRLLYELDILYEKAQTPLSKRLALFENNQQVTVKRVDALARQVLVYMQAYKYDQAIDLLQKYHFYRWEGGEQVRRYYVDVHLLRGLKYLGSQDYEKALQDFKAAYEYPENLEEGRPEENERFAQIFYYIGLAYDKLDDENQARNFYQKAADERIHNSPYLYYKSRAFGKLREPDSARAFANVLAGFAEAESQIDFFAKFGEKRSVRMQQADQHYLKGLAALARGRVNGAREAFKQALTLHPYHYWSEAQLSQLLEIWVYEGDSSQAPKRTTNDYPLSDQQNEQNWKKYEPMSDEFEGTLLDTEKWWPNNPTWKGRQPAFFYSGNVEVKDGKLHLYMRKNEVPEMPKEEGYHTYTSSAVKSKTTVKYGYFEVKAKPMNSAGSSSFWFYDQADDEWTEIDVYEIGGNSTGFENKYNMNAHVFRTPEEVRHWSVPAKWTAPFKFADDYHVFGLEWDEEKLKWYVDGVLVYWIENTHWHQPLTLNFDSETMPNWFGLPMDNDLPSVYKVEYVRAWKK